MPLWALYQVCKEDTLCPGLLMMDYREYSPKETPPNKRCRESLPHRPPAGVPLYARSLIGLADQSTAGI